MSDAVKRMEEFLLIAPCDGPVHVSQGHLVNCQDVLDELRELKALARSRALDELARIDRAAITTN